MSMMNRRETVFAALNHQATRPIPYHVEFTGQSLQNVRDATGKTAAEIESGIGSYLHYAQYWGWPAEMPDRPEHFRDEFGVIWNRSGADKDIGVVTDVQIPDIKNCGYTFPQPDIPRLRRDIETLLASREDKFTFMGFGFSMFERCWSLMGMENALLSMITAPNELETLFTQIGDYFLRLVDVALEYDIDGVYFGDDWGQQKGMIMGPKHWRRFIKPQMEKLYRRVKSKGKFVIQHSCGDVNAVLPDLIEIGLDCYQTFQPEIYNIEEVKSKYGDKLAFWGGVSTQRCLPVSTPKEVQAEIVRVVKALRRDGGLIIAPTHALSFDIPVENIFAMLEVFQNQERFFEKA